MIAVMFAVISELIFLIHMKMNAIIDATNAVFFEILRGIFLVTVASYLSPLLSVRESVYISVMCVEKQRKG